MAGPWHALTLRSKSQRSNSNTYAGCCCRRSSRVVWSVCVSVCVGNVRKPCKKAKPIEMVFGGLTRVSPRNHVLDGVQIFQEEGEGSIFGVVRPTKKHWESLLQCTQKQLNRWRCRLGDDSCGRKEPYKVWVKVGWIHSKLRRTTRWRCCLLSEFFHHLLLLLLLLTSRDGPQLMGYPGSLKTTRPLVVQSTGSDLVSGTTA